VLSAANEIAVAAFLAGQTKFTDIAALVARMLDRPLPPPPASLEDVLAIDAETRARAREQLEHA
jgi:1-deoxy-D-xylulose-5-phosphate reductoisomerase